jgi:hypothetical protein
MKTLLVTVDTNDADYVREIVEVDEDTLEHFKPLIEKIKNFKSYKAGGWTHYENFPVGECLREDLGEKHPMELYNLTEEEYECFIDTFNLWGGEWGFHTIESIQEITLGERIL